MPTKYNRLMSRVEVTPDMHERIMNTIRKADLHTTDKPARPNRWLARYRKYAFAAATLLVLLGGVLIAYQNQNQNHQSETTPSVATMNPADPPTGAEGPMAPQNDMRVESKRGNVEGDKDASSRMPIEGTDEPQMNTFDASAVQTLQQLQDTVGFNVKTVQALPFKGEQPMYTAIGGTLAQIQYTGNDGTDMLTFRMSADSGDNSGDYTNYADVRTIEINGYDVILKGSNAKYQLASWQQDGYSYSIKLINGVTEQQMQNMIQSVQ
ncbi:DUF4367 domain-containing protein [Paenibacillus sp. WLX2291]|uniref:DUF4367 domain-containing protein n=1 Tax=Paenibacillus sp. WLX2291 TaxID=3296934 RepID=UPI003983F44B